MEKESIVATLLRRLNAVTGLNEPDIAAIRALPIIVRPWEAGRAIVSDGPRERAEVDCYRLHGHGLWATIEQ